MKKTLKERLITLLKNGEIDKFNRYREFAKYKDINLSSAYLRYADLRSADLSSADLSFASITLSCSTLKMKTCEKIRKQFMFHTISLMKHADNLTEKEKEIFEFCKDYANEFHRTDVEKL